MKKFCVIFLSIVMASAQLLSVSAADNTASNEDFSNLKMRWSEPMAVKTSSGSWTYGGTPIGNGQIGAKIYGGVSEDIIQLNDAFFWSGGPDYTDVYDETGSRKAAMEKTRELLEGDLTDWDNITAIEKSAEKMTGNPMVGSFMPVGNMILRFDESDSYKDYSRTLDLENALVTTEYSTGSTKYTRETFASYPDNVMASRISADTDGSVSFSVSLEFPEEKEAGHGESITVEGNQIIMRWRAPVIADWDSDTVVWNESYGMEVEARVNVEAEGGEVYSEGNSIIVSGADEAVLLYASETSFNGYDKNPTIGSGEEKDPSPIVAGYIENAGEKSFDELKKSHIDDYQSIFKKLYVDINGEKNNSNVLAFQYQRYEIICCSRKGTGFRTAYGLWNPEFCNTSWGAHYMNENVSKTNAFIEAANIPETGEPIWNWLEDLSENGRKTAEYDWGFDGWTAPHYSDIWCSTALKGGRNEWAIYPMGGIWTVQLIWEHYAYNKDIDFLRDRAYPLLKGASEFALDLLVEREFTADEITGEPGTYLVTSPSTSAENSYGLNYGEDFIDGLWEAVSVGSTQDMTMIRGLFEYTMEAQEILGVDTELYNRISEAYDKLLPFQINKKGELQEWAFEQYGSNWNRDLYKFHRHASHLLCVWPYNFITEDTPELYDAAKTSLELRGSGGYHPDKAAMWVRLGEPDKALSLLNTTDLIRQWGGSLQNAFCEFIMQSQNGYIDLLPALPTSWERGTIKGIRARGGFELDIEWENRELKSCVIYCMAGDTQPEVMYNGEMLDVMSDSRITVVDSTKEEIEAENIVADIKSISKSDDEIKMEYTASSYDNDTATNISAFLAMYENTPDGLVLRNASVKNNKIYNTSTIDGKIVIDGSEFVGDGKSYTFKGYIWKRSNNQPIAETVSLENIEFKPKEIYSSINDFSGNQGNVWYYQSTADNVNFKDLTSFNSEGQYWTGSYSWLRVGGSFMHPQTENAVRTFKAPVDGTIIISKSTVKAEDTKGTADGINIKIMKNDETIYPSDGSEWKFISNSDHIAGTIVPEIKLDVTKGDNIRFILNQGASNGHDGTMWTNVIEYLN